MKELADVLAAKDGSQADRLAAQAAFLLGRREIWNNIYEGRFPKVYTSANGTKYSGAPLRTAIRCDFLLASKLTLGQKYAKDRLADQAQRDLLFYILRDRERFPERTGKKFYCCQKCTSKLYECVKAKVFRYIDNAKWKSEIEVEQTEPGAANGHRE